MNNIITEDLEYIVKHPIKWKKLDGKSVLISGGTGFIGWHIVQVLLWLVTSYKFKIFIALIVRNKTEAMQQYKDHLNNLVFIEEDLTTPIDNISSKYDYVIHAASNASPRLFNKEPFNTMLVNTIGTSELLKLTNEKFLLLGTSGIYGHVHPNMYPLSENDFGRLDCFDVANCYLESKRCAETMCVSHHKQYGTNIGIARLGINYGYGMRLNDGRSINTFIYNILNDIPFNLFGGNVQRSYLYIADTMTALFTILLSNKKCDVYNVTPDIEIGVYDLVKLLTELSGKNLEISYEDDKSRLSVDFPKTWMNNKKLRNLGWNQNFDIIHGLKRTLIAYGI